MPASRFLAALLLRHAAAASLALACLGPSHAMAQDDDDDEEIPDGALEFYVADTFGDPFGTYADNSPDHPFKTLDQARIQIRAYRANVSNDEQPIVVNIAGGRYHLGQPVVFTSDDSGWEGTPIIYRAWNPNANGVFNQDVLFTGGVELEGWKVMTTPQGVSAYVCAVDPSITEIRDVWVNNSRMVRARFPNVPSCATGPSGYANPSTPPCPNAGSLIVKRVEAVTVPNPPFPAQRRQRLFIRTSNGSTIPQPMNWSNVEASATRVYVNPHQHVGYGAPVQGQPDEAMLDFPLTSWFNGTTTQDLGALGIFYYDNWLPTTTAITGQRSYLELVGEDNLTQVLPRTYPAQLFLSNDLAFLDTNKEWHFDAENHELWLKLDCNPVDTGVSVVVPVARELLVLNLAEHLEFRDLDWAHTSEPMPVMADGQTPGYATIQTGRDWVEGQRGTMNNPVSAAVVMAGAQHCRLRRCRIAHTGGSGVIIGTFLFDTAEPPPFVFIESNGCAIQTCEIFDIGGHGVYIGDEFGESASGWAAAGLSSAATRDPSHSISVDTCVIEGYGVEYRDLVGISAGHTRDLYIGDTEIAWGNYTGISIGTHQAHRFNDLPTPGCGSAVLPLACGATANPAPNSEGTRIIRNDIHHVMLKLTDGGALYMQGSHGPSAALANTGRLAGNYIHDIALNPYLNLDTPPVIFGGQVCKAFYFETGSDGWHVWGNYVERVQGPYSFSPGTRQHPVNPAQCVFSPAIQPCQSAALIWYGPSWPHCWQSGDCGVNYTIPGQFWDAAQPNYWLDVAHAPGLPPVGAYDSYDRCFGYSAFGSYAAADGGMFTLTGPAAANRLLTAPNNPIVDPIKNAAGPRDTMPTFFFPGTVKRIHRTAICNNPASLTPEWQVQ